MSRFGKSRMAPNLISSRRPNSPLGRLRENISSPVPRATVTGTLVSVQLPTVNALMVVSPKNSRLLPKAPLTGALVFDSVRASVLRLCRKIRLAGLPCRSRGCHAYHWIGSAKNRNFRDEPIGLRHILLLSDTGPAHRGRRHCSRRQGLNNRAKQSRPKVGVQLATDSS